MSRENALQTACRAQNHWCLFLHICFRLRCLVIGAAQFSPWDGVIKLEVQPDKVTVHCLQQGGKFFIGAARVKLGAGCLLYTSDGSVD